MFSANGCENILALNIIDQPVIEFFCLQCLIFVLFFYKQGKAVRRGKNRNYIQKTIKKKYF